MVVNDLQQKRFKGPPFRPKVWRCERWHFGGEPFGTQSFVGLALLLVSRQGPIHSPSTNPFFVTFSSRKPLSFPPRLWHVVEVSAEQHQRPLLRGRSRCKLCILRKLWPRVVDIWLDFVTDSKYPQLGAWVPSCPAIFVQDSGGSFSTIVVKPAISEKNILQNRLIPGHCRWHLLWSLAGHRLVAWMVASLNQVPLGKWSARTEPYLGEPTNLCAQREREREPQRDWATWCSLPLRCKFVFDLQPCSMFWTCTYTVQGANLLQIPLLITIYRWRLHEQKFDQRPRISD